MGGSSRGLTTALGMLSVREREDFMSKAEMLRLRRRILEVLELAIAGRAPLRIIEPLGTAAGMLEALADVPRHELVSDTEAKAKKALQAWALSDAKHAPKAMA